MDVSETCCEPQVLFFMRVWLVWRQHFIMVVQGLVLIIAITSPVVSWQHKCCPIAFKRFQAVAMKYIARTLSQALNYLPEGSKDLPLTGILPFKRLQTLQLMVGSKKGTAEKINVHLPPECTGADCLLPINHFLCILLIWHACFWKEFQTCKTKGFYSAKQRNSSLPNLGCLGCGGGKKIPGRIPISIFHSPFERFYVVGGTATQVRTAPCRIFDFR